MHVCVLKFEFVPVCVSMCVSASMFAKKTIYVYISRLAFVPVLSCVGICVHSYVCYLCDVVRLNQVW